MRAALVLAVSLASPIAASAVLIDGPDGSVNVAPFSMPMLDNVGVRGGLTAIYVGDGIVVTANHVGAGDVSFAGKTYRYVPGSAEQLLNGDGTDADLLMFEIYPRPALPALALAATTPPSGSQLVLAGNGVDRGAPLVWDPNGTSPPGPTDGYAWAGASHLRWGTNQAEIYPSGRVFDTQVFGSYFDAGTGGPEAQAVVGDSGGAVFAYVTPSWKLAGVMIGITQYAGQPANTSFFGERTYYADLAYYAGAILEARSLPEPDHGLAPCAALLALVARARRRARVSSPSRCSSAAA